MSVSNFQIAQGSTLPWLDVQITKDGRLSLYTQAVPQGCPQQTVDPNALDLTTAFSVVFQLWTCGRTKEQIGLSGKALFVDRPNGIVRYQWTAQDTSILTDLYYGQFVITFKDGTILKWPFQLESLCIEVMGP